MFRVWTLLVLMRWRVSQNEAATDLVGYKRQQGSKVAAAERGAGL